MAALTAASLIGTSGEAGLLVNAAAGKSRVRRHFIRFWLRATTLMGLAGVAFHAYRVSRSLGGWRNWRQNAFNGPPLPAPPSFTGLAMAGLAALGLLQDHPDTDPTAPRYPGYNVLDKRHTPSWDAVTRRVVDHRIAVPREPRFFTAAEWQTADAICWRIVPQPADRPPVPLVALLDAKLLANTGDGFREGDMP